MRVLALDLGKRRIGLAISDELGVTAQGLETYERTSLRVDVERLAELMESRGVELILLGEPLHMSGDAGSQAAWVRDFGGRLSRRTGRPVRYWDERLTSREADRVLRSSGISIEKRARAIDRLSAVILLQSYLDASASGGPV
ncbi:MAG: Holliday junction resolvase RuvX [Bryobacteraceae bacterium]